MNKFAFCGLLLLATLALTAESLSIEVHRICHTFCPEPDSFGKYKCCDPEHPGICPAKAAFNCPPKPSPVLPKFCVVDQDCPSGSQKCCFDECFQRPTCRPAAGLG